MTPHRPSSTQRINLTVDVIDGPGNAAITLDTLLDIVNQLEHDAVIAVLVRLDIEVLRANPKRRAHWVPMPRGY